MKKLVVMVCTLVLLLGMGLYGVGKTDDQVAKKARKAYEAAQSLMKEKQWAKVEEKLKEAIQLEPEWAPPYAALGWLTLRENKIEEARNNLEKALELRPEMINAVASDYSRILSSYGLNSYNNQKFQESNGYFLKVIAIPNLETLDRNAYYGALNMAGTNCLNLKDAAKAEEIFQKLIKQTENKPDLVVFFGYGQFGMGKTLSMEKKYEAANPFLAKFVELNKDKADMTKFVAIANYMIGLNNYELLNQKKEAVMAEPISAEKKAKIDQLEAQKAKLIKASRAANSPKVIKLDNDIISIKNEDTKEKREKIDKLAKEAVIEPFMTAAIQAMPEMEDAYVKLGNYHYLCRNFDKSIEIYKKVIEKFPTSTDLSGYKKFLESIEKEKTEAQKKTEAKKEVK